MLKLTMDAFKEEEVERACSEIGTTLGYSSLKDHQLKVVKNFVMGSDVFAILLMLRDFAWFCSQGLTGRLFGLRARARYIELIKNSEIDY